MRLFQIPFSHNCVKVRRVLALKGLDYTTVNINPAWRGEVKRASGQELVPVLVDNGRAVSGSTPILLDIERRHPVPPLLPPEPQDRADCIVLMEWADATFMALTRRMAYYQLLTSEADLGRLFFPGKPRAIQLPMGKTAAQVLRRRFGISDAQNKRDIQRAREAARVSLDRLGDQECLVAGTLTLADVSLAAMAAPLQFTPVAGDEHVARLLEWARGVMEDEFTPAVAT
jgi:glutathione S-transferase